MSLAILQPIQADWDELARRYMQAHNISNRRAIQPGGLEHANFAQFFKQHGRRFIPAGSVVAAKMQEVLQQFDGRRCVVTGKLIVTPALREVACRQIALATAGLLSGAWRLAACSVVVWGCQHCRCGLLACIIGGGAAG